MINRINATARRAGFLVSRLRGLQDPFGLLEAMIAKGPTADVRRNRYARSYASP